MFRKPWSIPAAAILGGVASVMLANPQPAEARFAEPLQPTKQNLGRQLVVAIPGAVGISVALGYCTLGLGAGVASIRDRYKRRHQGNER